MSKEIQVFEIRKCISSRLCYTAFEICRMHHQHNISSEQSTVLIQYADPKLLIKIDTEMPNRSNCQWIKYLLSCKLFPDKFLHNENITTGCNNIAFQIVMDSVEDIPQHIKQELLLRCSDVKTEATSSEMCNDFSLSSLTVLKQYLTKNPAIACHIINMSYSYSFSILMFPDDLQDVYVAALTEVMRCLIPDENFFANEEDDELSFVQNKIMLNNDYLGTFLCILSKMILVESKKTAFLKWLCPIASKTNNTKDIELALYSRKKVEFINEWKLYMNELYGHLKSATTKTDAIRIFNAMFKHNNGNILTLNGTEILQRIMIQQSHWLTDVLDICYIFMGTDNSKEISMILSYPPLKYFWIILLLKFLDHCLKEDADDIQNWSEITVACQVLKFLLQSCNLSFFTDYTLCKLNTTLKTYVEVISWIQDLKRSHLQQSQDNSEPVTNVRAMSVKRVLYVLENRTVLSLLKEAINIHEIDHEQIKILLQRAAEPGNMFQAYCCMVNALRAILLCKTYDTKYQEITKYLLNMESHLYTLFPVSLRLETMENIFSFLFLSYSDFYHSSNNSPAHCTISNEKLTSTHRPVKHSEMDFICNKYAIRETLYYLKSSIVSAEIEMRKLKNDNMHREELYEISKKLSTLTKLLADARWRLDLHMNSYFIKNIGISESFTNKASSDILFNENMTYQQKKFDNVAFYQSNASDSDDTKIRTDSSSETEISNANEWGQSRNITASNNSVTKDENRLVFLINLMLSSKESLVIQCLWKNDYAKAQEVIKMFNMENTVLDGEIKFSQALQHFKQEMSKFVCPLKATNISKDNVKSSTLETIRLVAEKSMHSSRYTNQFEMFIASQEVYMRMLKQNVETNKILTLSVLDLALTIGKTHQISKSLCDVAMKYVKLCKSLNNTEHSHLFFEIFQLLHENKKDLTVTNLLCNVILPLSVKEWKEMNELWTSIMNGYSEFKQSQNQIVDDGISKDIVDLRELKIIQKLITYCNNSKSYLQSVLFYLQSLQTVTANYADENGIELSTVTELLTIPLHSYFSFYLFDRNVEPEKLEQIARKLKVDLVYTILISSCPKFPHYRNIESDNNNTNTGCIILNRNFDMNLRSWEPTSPNQCISEILTELLQALYASSSMRSTLSYTYLKEHLKKHPNIENILKKTSYLATLDLSELSIGDETLTFFLNTWNVMFIHTMLLIWANDPPFNNLRHTVSLMSIGYIIGDLGFVTLETLRSKLLGGLTLNTISFSPAIEELNEPAWQDLDLVQDPRVIFAMANEFNETPQIRVFESAMLTKSLNEAVNDYLNHYVEKFDRTDDELEKEMKVTLPHLLERYRKLLDMFKQNGSTGSLKENLLFIDDYLKLEKENLIIEYKSVRYSYEILLRYGDNSQFYTQSYQKSNNYQETLIHEPTPIKDNLLQYLEGRSWILSYLVQKMQNKRPAILNNDSNNLKRVACLENFLNSSWIKILKRFFNDNETFTGIHETVPKNELWEWFKVAWEDKKWEECLNVIDSLPDNNIETFEVQYFKDRVLSCFMYEQDNTVNPKILEYLYQIKDIHVLTQTILSNINKWQAYVCRYILIHALHHTDSDKLPLHCKLQMREILHRITIFQKMLPYCENRCNNTWYDVVYCTDRINPVDIIQSLVNADKFELCLEWLECQSFALEAQSSVAKDFLIGLLKNEKQNFRQALKLLQSLPLNQSVKICKVVLKKVESTSALSFLVNYLLQHSKTQKIVKYKRTLIGIGILKEIKDSEKPLYTHLTRDPLLMLEQLLMNSRFETVQKTLSMVHENLQDAGIPISEFDKIVRFYSKKALDFRVSLQRDGVDNKTKTTQETTSAESEINEFVMPPVAPKREEWIPNDKAKECSCCKTVIFSMFNRRHHCRRCGRVVCAVCSQNRMRVSGYPTSVLVRVCEDCKRQSALQAASQGEWSTPSSEVLDYWRLTEDEAHNKTIREEFSFEYAPSISLCLAILNLHSDHTAYTSFLLDRSDEMKQLLYPVNGKVNPEVDHIVIIKMIKSLLVAAKVKCAKLGFNTGLAHCDRFLSQIDLITTLVNSDCLSLIPLGDMDEHVLRKLRDLLTEKEQWTLALDVSTKSGLDTQGVWVAWGKACLKIGYFEQAREKFHRCLDKIISDDTDGWVVLSYPKEISSKHELENADEKRLTTVKSSTSYPIEEKSSLGQKKNECIKNRPTKDPPLLTEILQILDNLNINGYYVYHSNQKADGTPEILAIMNNLRSISQGQLTVKHVRSFEENIYYKESLYYLLTYGSYNSILEFYLKHEEFEKCLNYILENDLEAELFFNAVYMYCLRTGNAEKLQEAMKTKDPSLLIWKKYLIYVCHCLEKKQYLYILYQLQLFMKDCIRASMTCIRFYTNQASTYTDLCNRIHLLADAQKHLESELHIGSFNKKRRKSTSSNYSNHDTLTMAMEPSEIDKHINTISRQMEIAKFLGNAEKEGRSPNEFLSLFPDVECDATYPSELPTLFGNQQQKTQLAVLAILCGRDIEEGFGIAFRIMQDYNLPSQKVYSLAGHILALQNNVNAVEQLIKCCRSSGASNTHVICDHVLTHCIKLMLQHSYNHSERILKDQIDILIRLITDIELKISAYIESKQLKAAYLLAVKYSRAQDIRKILKESDRLGQTAIKAICTKWLQRL